MGWLASLALLAPATRAAAPPVTLFTDNFQSYVGGRNLDLQWQVRTGDWRVENGRLLGSGGDRGFCWAGASPLTADQQIEVTVVPGRRLAAEGWAATALALCAGAADYWRVALVEGPEGRRYAELLENRRDRWQAQSEGPTALQQLPGAVEGFRWEDGHAYRLRITVSLDRILGEVADDATGEVLFRRGFALPPGADAVRSGRPAFFVDHMEALFDDLRVTGSVVLPEGERPRSGRRAAVLDTQMPDTTPGLVSALKHALAAGGMTCQSVTPEQLRAPSGLSPETGLLILPHTRRLPLGVVEAVDRFLRSGGKAIFCGGPLGRESLVQREGRWVSVGEALAEMATPRTFIDFAHEDVESWFHAHGPGETRLTRTVEPSGRAGIGPALKVAMTDLHSWDTLSRGLSEPPLREGESLTTFWAKGDAKTRHLVMEWKEKDGSRWIATIPLSPAWRRYVLPPQEFRFWADNSPPGRGDPGDRCHPERGAVLSIGLAQSHAPLPGGPHTYWIADVGVAASPFPTSVGPPPVLEAVSPAYKTFVPSAAAEVGAADLRLPAPPDLRCAMPPSRGLGLAKARLGRWVPVLSARDRKGWLRGAAASLYFSFADPYANSGWGTLGTEDAAYLQAHLDRLGPVLVGMAKRLLDGAHLVKAGSDRFSYFPGEAPVLGAQVVNSSAEPQELRLVVTVTPKDRDTPLFRKEWPVSALPGVTMGASATWDPPVEPGTYVARGELWRGRELLEAVAYDFVCLPEGKASPSEFVQVRDGDFRLGDRPWHPIGLNFWPSNATGVESFSYWLHWLDPSNYDPEVIERNLDALVALRMNSVSIAVNAPDQLPALNHFLSRCAEKGLRANVHVGGAYATRLETDRVVEWIRAGRLADNPAIWAWDIAWEPHLGDYQARCALDGQWAAWIAERYGSIESAEKDWGVPAPRRADGAVTGPSEEQLLNDGGHRAMVAAYRRFVDDLVSRTYGEWARRVHEIDPRHLIGVRSGWGGTGSPWADAQFPLDLASGAKHLDFISPEGYGLSGPWANFERGGFITAYGRFAGAGKPVFWAEFGLSLYPDYAPEQIEAQRLLYEHLYRMALWSGASGTAGWWFPGGFRVDEKSDYGVMNPEGTPRPSALEARRWAPRFAARRPLPGPSRWIAIDRDLHPRGFSNLWARHADEYVAARRGGRVVGLRTEGTGTDSTTVPLIAVGNRPANGSNPPKFLNGEFGAASVRAGGEWTRATRGATVTVPPLRPVELAVSVGNTGEALWASPARAGSKPGGVFLVSLPGSAVTVRQPLPGDVPRFGDATIGPFTLTGPVTGELRVVLGLLAEGRTPFGEKFELVLRPQG